MSAAALEPDDELETLVCPDCGETITGPAKGRMNVSMKLGTHRWNKHQIRSNAKPRKGAPTDEDYQGAPVVSLVKDARLDAGTSSAPPSASALTNALGRALSLGIMTAAVHVVENDEYLPPGTNPDDVIDALSLSEKSGRELMAPVGRLFAPTRLNQRYGRQIVDNSDLISTGAELITLGANWRAYLRERRAARIAATRQNAPAAFADELAGYVADAPPTPAAAPEPPPDWGGQMTTPAMQSGHVVTSADIEAMRAGRL